MNSRAYRRRLWDYFLPFFIFIAFGVVVVLVVQFFHALRTSKEPLDVYLYTDSGDTSVLPWGMQDWQLAQNASHLLQGDEIRTSDGSRSMVKFFGSLWMRLDSNTEVAFKEAINSPSEDRLSFALNGGTLWFSASQSRQKDLILDVSTGRLRVRDAGSVFSVTKGKKEIVQVVKGKVQVDVLEHSQDSERVIDTLTVAAGQQAVLDDDQYDLFTQRQEPEIISDTHDDFLGSDWFSWNFSLDSHYDEIPSKTVEASASESDAPMLPAPVIIKPLPSERVVSADEVLIQGTIDSGTASVVVTTFENGVGSPYALSKFKSGDTSFQYIAALRFQNLKLGENRFVITAKDASGHESAPTEVIITYAPIVR